jgi:nucleotide-binding universal stress UspA family protein
MMPQGDEVIVMGVRGRLAMNLLLFGSTTNQVIRQAACPVLTLAGRAEGQNG